MKSGRSKRFIPWLLLGVVALIAYGSLYPFNFKRDAIEGGVLEALGQLSWVRAGRSDHVSNILLYIPLGFCLFLWLERGRRHWFTGGIVVAIGALLSLAIEVAQVFLSLRVPSLTDLSLNALGTLAGAVAGAVWGSLSGLIQLSTVGGNRGDRLAWTVVGLWLAWRFAPFVPQVSLAKLKTALRPLVDPQLDLAVTLGYLACWLAVAQAVFTLAARQGGVEALLVLIASVLVGRLLMEGQVFVPSELAALILLLPALVVLYRLSSTLRALFLIAAVAAVFLFERLAPFQFAATPAAFDLWPFLAWIDAGFPLDLRELFAFLFLSATMIWLLRVAGLPLDASIALVTAGVFVVEIVQMWQPDRVASITDPVLALGLGLAMRLIAPARRRVRLGFR